MAAKIVLITGCSSGLGLDFAKTLAADPAKRFIVYATMRNLGKKEVLENAAPDYIGNTLHIKELDVTKENTMVKCVTKVIEAYGRIDVLINNAGFGQWGAMENVSMDTIRSVMETNFFGPVRLTQEVISHMKKQKSGKVIFIGAGMGLLAFPFNEYYSAAKAALEGFAEGFAPIGRQFNIWVSTIEPGPVNTSFKDSVSENKAGSFGGDLPPETDDITKTLSTEFGNTLKATAKSVMQECSEITELVLKIIEVDKPFLRYPSNSHWDELYKTKYADTSGEAWVKKAEHMIKPKKKKVPTATLR